MSSEVKVLSNGPEHGIARMDTARAAFIGRTLRGPVDRPLLIRSFLEYQHLFGGLWRESPLGYAIDHFFDNGGREAYVVRVVNGARNCSLTLAAGPQVLSLQALRPGTCEFLRASVDYDNIASTDVVQFNLTVQRVRTRDTEQIEEQEIFPRLSVVPEAENYVGSALAESELIRLRGPVPARRPDPTPDSGGRQGSGYQACSDDGDDGAPLTDYDLIGSPTERSGLFALDAADHFNFLCVPPLSLTEDVGACTLLVAARYCKKRRAMLVVDPPVGWQSADDALRGMRSWELANENALMYFPRILAHDKLTGRLESFAPCGALAGMLARSDENSPVWASGRMDDAILRPGFRPNCLVTEDRRLRLAALGVNTIQAVRSAARSGVYPRTLAAGAARTADWRFLGPRRLALFIVNSIERATRWVLKPKPNLDVVEQATAQVATFLRELHDSGAFGARSIEDSYYVVCDGRVNPPSTAATDVSIVIGFAAERRREFHSFRITHAASGSKVTPVTRNRNPAADRLPSELDWSEDPARRIAT